MMISLRHIGTIGRLPTSCFDVINRDLDHPVGYVQVRHRPSVGLGMPPEVPNHIWYEIFEEKRNKGYGRQAFGLALQKAKKIGLDQVFVTCFVSNKFYRKIIESYGARLLSVHSNIEDNTVLYYAIKL